MDEVAAALKKMKRHKAPGMSGLAAEMIQSTGNIGTQWILDLCNGIVKEGCIPDDWKSSMVLPIYKGEGDLTECRSYRGIKLLEHAMKVVERIFKDRILQQIDIDDMQFGFMKGKGTTDDIYIYKIAQSVFVCPLSPPKRLDLQWPKLACRRVPTLSYTWAGSFVHRGHRLVEN